MMVNKGWMDFQVMPAPRRNSSSRKPLWILVLISLALIMVYLHPPQQYLPCYLLFSKACNHGDYWLPPVPARILTDEELIAKVVMANILSMPIVLPKNPKIAFMFMTLGLLPFEKLWEKFFLVSWGKIPMVDAEKRLLANALEDADNQHFVLLSDRSWPTLNRRVF